MEWRIPDLAQLSETARQIAEDLGQGQIVAFYGEMGAGKTTLIKALIHVLGAADEGTSPTFSLVNEYALPGGNRIFHFDFYRIESESEVFDLGYEDYFFSGNLCLIEWPEKIEALLPPDTKRLFLTVEEDQSRLVRSGNP